ncbi:MAG: purine-nucleoside phosphorylase [Chloroflexota bacterium]
MFTRANYQTAANVILSRTAYQPTVGLILGSGLGGLADAIEVADTIPTTEIPRWPRSTVEGHAGRLVIGRLEGQTVLALQGRVHYYEGYTMQEVTFPVRVMQTLGIKTLFVTNAAGGLNKDYHAGDLMLISDHINLPGLIGHNPLGGPNDNELGSRFPDMTTAYDVAFRQKAHEAAAQAGFTLREGVYVCVSGPSFETPAEIRMLRTLGADAVGMSTAPEVVVARHAGMRVMGVSVVTNIVVDTPGVQQTGLHEEVLATGAQVAPRLIALLRSVLSTLGTA